MQKKRYETPTVDEYGPVETITQGNTTGKNKEGTETDEQTGQTGLIGSPTEP
jgi:hypothetical protein